ncbi:MAG: aldehyde dehydrogenase, partial [Chloroflexi bacterium]
MKLMYINGRFVPSDSDETIAVLDPATEEVIDTVPNGNEADARKAIAAAKAAFADWQWLPGIERTKLLQEAAHKMHHHSDELAQLLSWEEGKPICESQEEMEWMIGTFNYYAEMARTYRGRVLAPADRNQFNFVIKEPYGVVACIVPFNFPLLLMAWKVAPALAAGNTVIIKPADQTPLSTLRLAETVFDHFPPGVINILTGNGPRVAEPLVTHKDVPVIAFTGSTAVGQRIARLA